MVEHRDVDVHTCKGVAPDRLTGQQRVTSASTCVCLGRVCLPMSTVLHTINGFKCFFISFFEMRWLDRLESDMHIYGWSMIENAGQSL